MNGRGSAQPQARRRPYAAGARMTGIGSAECIIFFIHK